MNKVLEGYTALASSPWGSLLAFVIGSSIGSFLNVVIARLPAGESIVRPRSRCPTCGAMIPWWLNVPVLSWILLRGRCRSCKRPISARYLMVELLTGLLFVACLSTFGFSLASLAGAILVSGLVVITFVDIDIWEIPDEISIPGIAIGCALRPIAFHVPWYDGILGALIGAAFLALVRWIYFLLRKTEGMGFGDVKLIAMIGAFLGPRGLVPSILVASLSGSLIGAIVLITARARGQTTSAPVEPAPQPEPEPEPEDADEEEDDWEPPPNAVPFGPFLALGALAQLFLGPVMSRLFLGL